MRVEVVEDNDITGLQGRRQLGLYVSRERLAIHGAVDDPGRDKTITPQSGNESLRMPFAERRIALEPLSSQRTSAQPAHIGLHGCFIDKDKSARLGLHRRLAPTTPFNPGSPDVAAFLFRRQQCFFYK